MTIRSVWFETFGCQMNEADTEKMAGILCADGYRLAAAPGEADVILINTCSIREKAEQKAFSLAGRYGQLKRKRPELQIAFIGCAAQRLGARVLERLPGVDVVLGPARLDALPSLLARVRSTGRPVVDIDETCAGEHPARPLRKGAVKAWVNVMFGCDNFCAYCVVPLVRGRERSRRPAEVLAEVAALGRAGYREVTLLGQNVNSYGHGLEPRSDFAGLLRALDGSAGIPRLRFTTSHPKDFSKGLMRAVRDLPSVCEAVHLPLQAGADSVLQRMNRGYLLEEYRRIVGELRETVPGVAITTDIIVGFPGESVADFEKTLEALAELRFDAIFSFRYSPREGTAAFALGDSVAAQEKARRLIAVQSLQREITESWNAHLVGREIEVLIEGPSRRDPGNFTGRTRTNRIVNFPAVTGLTVGDLAQVQITEAGFLSLAGRAVAHSCAAAR